MADVSPGHAPFLLCMGAGNLVRPATVVRNKTTIDSEQLGLLTWGAAQLGIAQGVCDAVDEGLIPLEHVDDLVLLIALYVDPEAGDHTALRMANRAGRARRHRGRAAGSDHRERARELIAGRDDGAATAYLKAVGRPGSAARLVAQPVQHDVEQALDLVGLDALDGGDAAEEAGDVHEVGVRADDPAACARSMSAPPAAVSAARQAWKTSASRSIEVSISLASARFVAA